MFVEAGLFLARRQAAARHKLTHVSGRPWTSADIPCLSRFCATRMHMPVLCMLLTFAEVAAARSQRQACAQRVIGCERLQARVDSRKDAFAAAQLKCLPLHFAIERVVSGLSAGLARSCLHWSVLTGRFTR